ncbi:MAG: GNAT family N-acetyltransferase [Roseobacter sp.]
MPPSVRALTGTDTQSALALYRELTLGPKRVSVQAFHAVLNHPGTTVFGVEHQNIIVGMATLHLLPNVTWDARPYGLLENVVTHPDFRNQGIGRAVLKTAIAHAFKARAYKIMLMTGQKRGAKGFYESVGFSSEDKHAMVIRQPITDVDSI